MFYGVKIFQCHSKHLIANYLIYEAKNVTKIWLMSDQLSDNAEQLRCETIDSSLVHISSCFWG